ncbi:MAG TPA: RsiV family protein [Bradyrhizobium sp.]|nr:RsiV family protein [Bradyrhizobium sp.]
MRQAKLHLAVLLLVSLQTALAAEPRPDAAIKTRAIEANVFLDAGIKADPPLAADCLAEGRKWLDKNAGDAARELKQDPQFFKDGGWAFERKYAVRSIVADRYVSVIRSDYMDTHGAHPNTDINTILWDRSDGKRISIRPFFNETVDNGPTMTAMRKAVIAGLKAEKKKRDSESTATDEWLKGVEPKLTKIGAVALAPSTEAGKSSGFIFYFPPYAVGPYAEGQYAAFVPWELLQPSLSPQGMQIFGGARPKSDEAIDAEQ